MAVEIPVIIDIEQAFQNAAKQVNSASAPLKSSIEALNDRIKEDFELLNMSKVSDPVWKQAAKDIQIASQALEVFNDHVAKYTTNEGSIKRLNAELASVSRRWAEMGAQQKFTATGELTADAQKLVSDYRNITKEIQKQGKSLEQIIAEEQRIEALKQKGIQTRRYENAILKATGNTIRVLEEKERILSSRLSTTKIGSSKYRQLKTDLEAVRLELERVNGRVATATIPALDKANSRLTMLVKRSIELVALHSATRFVRNIREVTAEFELQRVALGSIIQDTERANALFKQIKAAAIESPFQIKELVTYTKQLSAYRIETEDLFNVTMKLADVSAGLGVDMGRLILAYGQVRAAAVLRGQELRQFTEAGIPLVEKLAERFTKLRGETVRTADVFELISKRAVPFEMVAEIFDDMTERGGIFYKMQEKQAETLAGQWSNLKDSLSIMYDEMGNTSAVHGAMEALIRDAKTIFQNWHLIANAVKIAALQFGAFKIAGLWLPNLRRELGLSKRAQDAYNRSLELSKYAMATGSKSAALSAKQLRRYSAYMSLAAKQTNFLSRAYLQLKAVMAGTGWISALVAALSALSAYLISAAIESGRLNRELKKIETEGSSNITRSVANFERLAEQAVNAADGSREQAKALAELERTYGDLIPTEQLQIDALRRLEGNYDSVTRAIREKINEQIREQQVSTISDTFNKKLSKRQRDAKEYLATYGLDKEQISIVLEEIQKEVEKGNLTIEKSFIERRDIFQKIIKDLTGLSVDFSWDGVRMSENQAGAAEMALNRFLDVYLKMDGAIKDVDNSMRESIGTYGKFGKMAEDMGKSLQDIFVDEKKFGEAGTFANNQERIRQSIEVYWDYLKKAFDEVNAERGENKIDITKALLGDGKIDFDVIEDAVKEAMKGGLNTRLNTFVGDIQKKYENLVPSDRVVNAVREKVTEVANHYGVSMDVAQRYFKKAETSMEDYVKSLQDAVKENKSLLKEMEFTNQQIADGKHVLKGYDDETLQAQRATNQFLDAILLVFDAWAKHTGGSKGSYTQDPFIAQMQERMKFMQDFKKGYDEFNKYLSKSDALAEQASIMEKRGLSLGVNVAEQKRAAEELADWYAEAREKAFEQAKTHGATGTIDSFLSQEIKDTGKNAKALKDFQKLLQSLWDAETEIRTDKKKKEIEDALQRLSDEIKRTETARNFYNNILDLTGDEQLAATMGVSVYGDIGSEFKKRMQEQLEEAMKSIDPDSLTDELKSAFEKQDFDVLLKNLDKFPQEWQKRLKEMAESDEKYTADLMKNFADLISKYGDAAQKIATIKAKTKNEIDKVNEAFTLAEASGKLTPEELKALKERRDEIVKTLTAQQDLDIFKQSDDYVKFFSEINVMTAEQAVLVRGKLREAYLKAFHEGAISADELRRNLRAVDEQFKKLSEDTSVLTAYLNGGFEGAIKKVQDYSDTISILASKMKSGKSLDAGEEAFANRMLKSFGGMSEGTSGIGNLSDLLSKNSGNLQQAGEAFGQMGEAMGSMAANGPGALAIVDAIIKAVNSTITGIQQLIDQINEVRSEDKKVGGWFSYLSDFNKYAYSGWEKLKSGDIIGAATDTISSLISVYNNVKKTFNKIYDRGIEKQTKLIEDLGYEYSRLGVAIEDAFGSDYIYNFQKQTEILQAQAEAYRKQAELERKKGKSGDEKTAQGYEKSAREIEDQIKDMQGQLAEFFTGTDLTSAARDFAQAWIDAYKEFGSTTDAMREKFDEMIENMVVNSLAAKLIQSILDPLFKQIDAAAEGGDLTAQEMGAIATQVPGLMDQINNSMGTLMGQLTSAGINLRQQAGQFTGISRDIAGASEESILGLAAGVNTANFYMSHLPAIAENVAALRAYIVGDAAATVRTTASEGPTYEDQMLGYAANLPMMRDDMYAVRSLLEKVIKPVGSAYYVFVR